MLSWLEIDKLLLLHLVGCLYYLYQWCTAKQLSDNEIYLLIKYRVYQEKCARLRIVFLMLKCNDITHNTYNQIWTVTEIMAREKCGLLAVPRTAPVHMTRYVYTKMRSQKL